MSLDALDIAPDQEAPLRAYFAQLDKLQGVVRNIARFGLANTWEYDNYEELPHGGKSNFGNFASFMNGALHSSGVFAQECTSLSFMNRAKACAAMGFATMPLRVTPGVGDIEHPASLVLDIVQLEPQRGVMPARIYQNLSTLGVSDERRLPRTVARMRFAIWTPTLGELTVAAYWKESGLSLKEAMDAAHAQLRSALVGAVKLNEVVADGGGETTPPRPGYHLQLITRAELDEAPDNGGNGTPPSPGKKPHLRLLPPV